MSEKENILSLDRLSVRLPRSADRIHALRDVSLEIASNEILCVVADSVVFRRTARNRDRTSWALSTTRSTGGVCGSGNAGRPSSSNWRAMTLIWSTTGCSHIPS